MEKRGHEREPEENERLVLQGSLDLDVSIWGESFIIFITWKNLVLPETGPDLGTPAGTDEQLFHLQSTKKSGGDGIRSS